MYQRYFGMRDLPFSPTPNTAFYVDLPGHREAINVVLVALNGGESLIKITGEVGTGKTLLCQRLAELLRCHWVVARVDGPELGPLDLQLALADQLGIPLSAKVRPYQVLKYLKEILIDIQRSGTRTVLLVDEAQVLGLESLEELRLLGNLQSESQRLLQVVLVGQPELDRKLAQNSMRQFRQRVAFAHHLRPLGRACVREYIASRLLAAGYRGGHLFSYSATSALHRASGGVPRLINTLCHKSLLWAYGRGDAFVGREHVRRAAVDTPEAQSWIRLPLLGRGSAGRGRRRRAPASFSAGSQRLMTEGAHPTGRQQERA